MKEVVIKSFNGIGDLLFVTPTLRVIKKAHPHLSITVNTNFPGLLRGNPFVDKIGTENEGVFLGYPDPIHTICPTEHHIITDWKIVTKHHDIPDTEEPELKPELYCRGAYFPSKLRTGIGVQGLADCKWNWSGKRVWPHLDELIKMVVYSGEEIRRIPIFPTAGELVSFIAKLKLVVCTQGGIQQIARAVNTPAVVIYGGFAKPEWNGYEVHANIVNPKPCSYCWHPGHCISEVEERQCLREISMGMVLEQISAQLYGG